MSKFSGSTHNYEVFNRLDDLVGSVCDVWTIRPDVNINVIEMHDFVFHNVLWERAK
jgi:hypothetical protein